MSVIQTRDQMPQVVRGPIAPGHRPAPAATGGMTGRDILRILLRRKWLIVIALMLFIGMTVIGTWLWQTYVPFYKAEALIEVIPTKNILAADSGTVAPDIMERQVAQFAQMIRRPSVLLDALKDKEVLQTGWYAKYGKGADPAKRLGDELDVSPVAKTNLITISMTSPMINDVATIVNAVAQAAVDDTNTQKTSAQTVDLKKVTDELTNYQIQRKKKADEIATYLTESSTTNTTSLEARQESLRIGMGDLVPKLRDAESKKNDAEKKMDLFKEQVKDTTRIMEIPEVGDALARDPNLAALRQAKMNYQSQLDDLRSRGFGEGHRAVQKLEGMLKSIQAQEEAATKETIGKAVQMASGMRTAELTKTTDDLVQLRTQSDRIDAEAREVAQKIGKVNENKEEILKLDKAIERFENTRQNMTMAVRTSATAVVRNLAILPKKDAPDQPKWTIMLPIGTIIGLVVGLGLAFLLELVDTSIKSPSDISRRMDLAMLGMVPHEDDTQEEIKDLRLACMNHPTSLFSESFRQIRTCLMFSGPADKRRSLLVTSPQPEDGRTVVAMNLGTAVAAGGRKVLIVDANFRQPMIRKLFPQTPIAGLSSAMTGQAPWRELVCQVAENLYVMASGPLPPNPAELLHSDLMRQLIAEMTAEYDQVIFDGAPALVVTDSPVLSTMVDGVILVVRAGSNTHGIVQRARDTFARVGAHMIGIVLNGVRVSAGGYLRKNYETFYEYQTPAQLPPQ